MTIAMPLGFRSESIVPLEAGAALGRLNRFEARLARGSQDIEKAQALRHRVFFRDEHSQLRDQDRFDAFCDHLLVVEKGAEERIVGTYRLMREEAALAAGGFYSAGEFAVAPLLARNPHERFMELGRSCVDPDFRARGALETMWQAIWAYCGHYRITAMMGCGSFHGTVPALHAEALSYLAHFHRADGRWAVAALCERHVEMDLMPMEAVDTRSASAKLPPLLRGYLRLGAKIGHGAVVDADFGTTDVFVVLPTGEIGQRYLNYYAPERRAA